MIIAAQRDPRPLTRILVISTFTILILLLYVQPLKANDTSTKIIPLPIYATLPNEGNTFGFMPVFLVVDNADQRTESILAPSISWNSSIDWTSTFRWYYYPDSTTSITLIPSFSTHINRNLTLALHQSPTEEKALTNDSTFHMRRDIFYRFFGIGDQSQPGDESSYTRDGGDITVREGYNIAQHINVGVVSGFKRDLVENIGVSGLPLTAQEFPTAPGLNGSTVAFEGLSARYDTRRFKEYSSEGFTTEVSCVAGQGIAGSGNYVRTEYESKILIPETSALQSGARVFWGYTGGSNIPFFYLSSLGGSYRLRGFTEDRFIDKGAWEAEFEQRILVMQTHIYGVTADWRIDPFISAGQVYSDFSQIIEHVHYSAGLGFRAFVRPNVLGRVDVAYGGEGVKTYVELGYPF